MIRNFCGRDVTILAPSGARHYLAEGVAWCEPRERHATYDDMDLAVVYGWRVHGLPEYESGVRILVAPEVAMRMPARIDLISPWGEVPGCRGVYRGLAAHWAEVAV